MSDSSKVTAKRIVFTGRVQGVGFRFAALRIADRYALGGWVRNLPDGAVEMLAQGDSRDIDQCLRNIEESFRGYITETRIDDAAPDPEYADFKITY